jgi:hypothetical protein
MYKIEKHVLTIKRSSLQGGIPNERYSESLLYDSRLTNHIPTDCVMTWKGYKSAGKDSKFTDLVCNDKEIFAEGKVINRKTGVCLRPSVDTGGGRGFRQENLDACFEKNSHYFLYETTGHTDSVLTIEIYWIPIEVIRDWYDSCGSSGKIAYTKLKQCISQCEIVQTSETRD